MKKIYLLMMTFAMFSITFAQTLTVNGTFETWTAADVPDSWTKESGTNLSQETGIVHGGVSAMRVELTTATQGNTDFRQTISVEAGKKYDFSFWVYQLDDESSVKMYVTGGANSGYAAESDITILNAWQEVYYQFTATTTGDIAIGLRFYDNTAIAFDGSSSMIIDDYSVIENLTVPVVENIIHTPSVPTVADAVNVSADITDNGTITTAILTWTNDAGATTSDINMSVTAGNTYTTDTPIPAQVSGTTVSYFITVVDNDLEQTITPNYGYYIGDFCNGDFETWTTGTPDCWSTIDAGVSVTQETSIKHGGASAMRVDVLTTTQAETDITQFYNTVAGQTYTVSVWVYQLDTLSDARLYFGTWYTYSDKLLVNQWQELTYEYTATTSAPVGVGLRFYDQANYVDHSNIIIDDYMVTISTGISKANNTKVEFYPNPVKDVLTFKGLNNASVEIININGKVVKAISKVSPNQTLNVADLKQGIYFVKINTTEGTKVSKLVKL